MYYLSLFLFTLRTEMKKDGSLILQLLWTFKHPYSFLPQLLKQHYLFAHFSCRTRKLSGLIMFRLFYAMETAPVSQVGDQPQRCF